MSFPSKPGTLLQSTGHDAKGRSGRGVGAGKSWGHGVMSAGREEVKPELVSRWMPFLISRNLQAPGLYLGGGKCVEVEVTAGCDLLSWAAMGALEATEAFDVSHMVRNAELNTYKRARQRQQGPV